MSGIAVGWALQQTTGSPVRKAVLLTLATYADDKNASWPSIKTLMLDTELSDRAIQKALRELETRGFIVGHNRHKQGERSTSRRYALVMPERGNTVHPQGEHSSPPGGTQFTHEGEHSSPSYIEHPKEHPKEHPEEERARERASKATSKVGRKKSEKTTMPADWVLTPGLRERIRTEAKMPDGLIDADVAKACRHYREGNGRSTGHVNWDLAIFNWCDKTMRDSANQGGRPNGSTSRPNGYGLKPLKTPELEARVIAEWTTKVADLGWAQPPSPRMAGYSYKVREEQPKEIQDQWMKAHQLLMRMESEAYREPGV
jgi:hypothetical protein